MLPRLPRARLCQRLLLPRSELGAACGNLSGGCVAWKNIKSRKNYKINKVRDGRIYSQEEEQENFIDNVCLIKGKVGGGSLRPSGTECSGGWDGT